MRVGYSILRGIKNKHIEFTAATYGLKEYEFQRMIRLLEYKGFVERVLRVGDNLSLKPARLTEKGAIYLKEYSYLELDYPLDKMDLKEWVKADKTLHSNEAEEDYLK
jgi:hypothetical protein